MASPAPAASEPCKKRRRFGWFMTCLAKVDWIPPAKTRPKGKKLAMLTGHGIRKTRHASSDLFSRSSDTAQVSSLFAASYYFLALRDPNDLELHAAPPLP